MRKKSLIKIYTTASCHWCKVAKKFLKDQNVAFDERNVRNDSNARIEMILKSGQIGVPVLDIAGTIVVGFDANEINKVIKEKYAIRSS